MSSRINIQKTMALFKPLKLGDYVLEHRIVMAPLTRMRATEPFQSPDVWHAEYYHQRASKGGLIIAEATQVCQQGQGYPSTPGIFRKEQIDGWRLTTDKVHSKGGLIFLQLWHVGRVSHSCYQPNGAAPVSASDIPMKGRVLTPDGPKEAPVPHALTKAEIKDIVEYYRRGAINAKAAGFDGVELHSANGYLIDQFFNNQSNKRNDEYGGSVENRSRLCFEALEAIVGVWGPGKVGIRLSPHDGEGPNYVRDSNPETIYTYVLSELERRYNGRLAYVHIIETTRNHGTDKSFSPIGGYPIIEKYRPLWSGTVIGASGFTPSSAEVMVQQQKVDAVAFGRFFISTPDLPHRIKEGIPPNKYDRSTFYTLGTSKLSKEQISRGYTDYPIADLSNPDMLFDFSRI